MEESVVSNHVIEYGGEVVLIGLLDDGLMESVVSFYLVRGSVNQRTLQLRMMGCE